MVLFQVHNKDVSEPSSRSESVTGVPSDRKATEIISVLVTLVLTKYSQSKVPSSVACFEIPAFTTTYKWPSGDNLIRLGVISESMSLASTIISHTITPVEVILRRTLFLSPSVTTEDKVNMLPATSLVALCAYVVSPSYRLKSAAKLASTLTPVYPPPPAAAPGVFPARLLARVARTACSYRACSSIWRLIANCSGLSEPQLINDI